MADTVTFRLDPETARILRELTRRTKHTKSEVIKQALRERWNSERVRPTSWEVYLPALSEAEATRSRRAAPRPRSKHKETAQGEAACQAQRGHSVTPDRWWRWPTALILRTKSAGRF